MKKVKLIKVKAQTSGWGFFRGYQYEFSANQVVIDMIEKGWDFCGYIPCTVRSIGGFETISLIFQKESDEVEAKK